MVLLAAPLEAQRRAGGGLEVRSDVVTGDMAWIHGGFGAIAALSTYARAAAIVGAGPAAIVRAGGGGGPWSFRAEAVVRFHTDPFRQRRWAPYGAAGAGALWISDADPFIVVLLGMEGPRRGAWAPAIEIGVSRGVRIAVALRRTGAERR